MRKGKEVELNMQKHFLDSWRRGKEELLLFSTILY